MTDLLDASVSPTALGQRPLGLRPTKGEQGVGQHRDFPSSLIHSLIHWFLEAVYRRARRKGGAPRTAPSGCGPAPEGRVRAGRARGRGRGARAGGGRPGWAGAAACAGSEWLAAGGGSERPGASRSASPPPGPQLRLLRLVRTRPHSDRPPLGAAAAPPAARSRPAPAAAAARSVSQSVSHGARGAGAAGAHGVSGEGAPRLRRRWRRGQRERRLLSPGPLEDRAAAAVSAQPRPRGGRRGRPGADCEALPRLPPPFSRRPAPPSGRGAGGWPSLGRGRCRAGAGLVGPRPARRWRVGGGRWGQGCPPASLGAATEGDNEIQDRLGRVRLGLDPAPGAGGPGPRGGKDCPRLAAESSDSVSGIPRASVPPTFHK